MNTNQAGKGSKPRPVNKQIYNQNFEEIKWNQSQPFKPNVSKKGKTTYKY
jgi:hypothetical protein